MAASPACRRMSFGGYESPHRNSLQDSPMRRSASGYSGASPTAGTPSRNSRYTQGRRWEDPNIRVVELCGKREQFPRPPGDISAECLYKSEVESMEPQSPSRSQRRENDKNAGRQFLWPTMDSVVIKPSDTVGTMPIPLATICCPFADGAGDSTTLPLSEMGADEPVRCTRCRCYVNPFFKWSARGDKRLQCNMCGHHVEAPQSFYDDMERAGQCADEDNHPELVFGSVDFTAPSHYDVDRPSGPSEPAVCFAVESSADAVRSGYSSSCLRAIRSLFVSGSDPEEAPALSRRVCLLLFDEAVHCFAATRSGRFQAVSMRDVDDPYIPVAPVVLFVDPRGPDGQAKLCALLEHLEAQLPARLTGAGDLSFGAADGSLELGGGVAGGAALQVATDIVTQTGGGDVIIFHASNPNIGVGALRPEGAESLAGSPASVAAEGSPPASPKRGTPKRPTPARFGFSSPLGGGGGGSGMSLGDASPAAASPAAATPSTRRNSAAVTGVLAPPRQQAAFYSDLHSRCIRGGVAISCVSAAVFPGQQQLQPPPPLDVSTLQWLPWRTGGETLHMSSFTTESLPLLDNTLKYWSEKMQASAYGCVVKLRTSKGLSCKSLIAAWPAASSSDDSSAFELARLSPDVSFAFTLQTEEEPEQEQDAYTYRRDLGRKQLFAQVAVLYTSGKGERLLRVHTCLINVVPAVRQVFNAVSIAPLMALMIKQVILLALGGKSDSKALPRDCLLEFCLQVIAAFHQHNYRGEMDDNALALSKKLQLLPLYTLGARKLLYMATSGNMDRHIADEFLRRLLRMPIHSVMSAIYPRIYTLQCTPYTGPEMPRAGFASKDYLTSGNASAYLIVSCFGSWFYHAAGEGEERGGEGSTSPKDASPNKAPSALGDAAAAAGADPELTPEGREAKRAELWKSAEVLSQRIREVLAPGPVWMPLSMLPRLPAKASDLDVDWSTRIFFSAIFVEDEGVTEMEYTEWIRFVHAQARRMLAQ